MCVIELLRKPYLENREIDKNQANSEKEILEKLRQKFQNVQLRVFVRCNKFKGKLDIINLKD